MPLTNPGITLSQAGNTAGATAFISTGTMVLAGGNNITLSQNANSLTISGGGGGAGFSAGASNVGNTAGATGVSGTRMVLVGTNNVTLSQTTDANGNTISISAAGGGAGQFSGGVSNLGNTAGATGISGSRMVLVGSNNLTLSQTTDANGNTISILDSPIFSKSRAFNQMEVPLVAQANNATLFISPIELDSPSAQWDRAIMHINWTNTTNSTVSLTLSAWVGLYTRNASTLSLAYSSSTAQMATIQGTADASLYHGHRHFHIGWTTTITQNDYWLGVVYRSTTGGGNGTLSYFGLSAMNSSISGSFGAASNASNQLVLGLGVYSASTAGLPSNIPFSDIRGNSSAFHRPPAVWFISGSA